MNLNLKNKNAIVGGGSKGIGKAVAKELALLGANVTLLARGEDALKKAVNELDKAKDQKHDFFSVDNNDTKEFKNTIEKYLSETKKTIHILVNNTGGPPGGTAIDAKIEEYIFAYNKHLICNQILTQLVVDGMKKENYGRIINIISTSVKAPIRGLGVSNTVRAAVANWAKTLSFELGEFGITVNNVLPGFTMTDRLEEIIENNAEKTKQSREQILEKMKSQVPLKRIADAAEVAAAAAFLASPAASYITGINLPVDGGRTECL